VGSLLIAWMMGYISFPNNALTEPHENLPQK